MKTRPIIVAMFWPASVLLCLAVCVPSVCAQQLSIRHYDIADGLAHSHVTAIHQDAKGYLWLATWEGLSRFDGYRFTNYGRREGLGDPIINDIVEDRQGRLWVATNGGGVARLIDDNPPSRPGPGDAAPDRRQKFVSFRVTDWEVANRVNALLFDSQNNLWCVTDGGLYRAATAADGDLKFETIVPYQTEKSMAAYADQHGRLWFAIQTGLIEIADGQIITYGHDDQVGRYDIESIVEDNEGRLLVANEREVYEWVTPAARASRGRWRRWPLTFKPDQGINAMLSDAAGALWVGTWDGLVKYDKGKQTLYTSAQGLSDNSIASLLEDRDGNLWIGTIGGGVCKLSGELVVSFTRTEGLTNQAVRKVIEDQQGNIYASIQLGGLVKISEGRALPLKGSQALPFNSLNERILQDRRGDWWIGTDAGLYRFQGPELQLQKGRIFTARDGLAEGSIMGGVCQDQAGRVWLSPEGRGFYYCDATRQGRVVFTPLSPNLSAPLSGAQRMISDRAGALWLGGHGELGRLINGQFMLLQPSEGLPETRPRAFFLDSRGWLWIGLRYKGVSVTKDPDAATPQFVNYSTANGLASDAVWAITEDDFGRLYLGTGKGLDQLDPTTGQVRHFNTEDGLASDVINDCLKDKEGNIWVGTTLGLSKFNPRAERRAARP